MSNPVDAALAKARETAENVPATTTQDQPPAPANTNTNAAPLTLDDFTVGSMDVDAFLKVKEFGLLIGTNDTLFKTLDVKINPGAVQVCNAIKFGNPAQYLKTYDNATCVQGGSWQNAIARAQQVNPNARPYPSADIPMTLLTDVKDDDGKVILEKGSTVGHSLSTTNRGEFTNLINELKERGLESTTVKVKLGFKKRTNKAGNVWGVMTFQLVDAA